MVELDVGINLQTKEGYTPLMLASWFGHFDVVRFLTDKGADVNLIDNYLCNALHRACQCSNTSIAVWLMDHGIEMNRVNKEGTPLQISCSVGDVETMTALLDHGADTMVMFNGKTLLHLAVLNYRMDMVKMLLDRGGDVNQRDSQGNTCLHLAAWSTQDKVVRLLLDRGAEVDAENRLKETPLEKAAEIGSGSIFEMLVRAGANLSHKDKIGRTAMDWAAIAGHDQIKATLAKIEAEKRAQEEGNRPLMLGDMSESSASFTLSSASFADDLLSRSSTAIMSPGYEPPKTMPEPIMEDVT